MHFEFNYQPEQLIFKYISIFFLPLICYLHIRKIHIITDMYGMKQPTLICIAVKLKPLLKNTFVGQIKYTLPVKKTSSGKYFTHHAIFKMFLVFSIAPMMTLP